MAPIAVNCATGTKTHENQLEVMEIFLEENEQRHKNNPHIVESLFLGDSLRVPDNPLTGDALSFHLPIHRALDHTIKDSSTLPSPPTYVAVTPRPGGI